MFQLARFFVFSFALFLSHAQADLQSEAKTILEAIVLEAKTFELPSNIEIEVVQVTPPLAMSNEDITALRRLSAVDTNARMRLERYESELDAGSVRLTKHLYWKSAESWRLNNQREPRLVVDFHDSATNGAQKWLLSDRQLSHAKHGDVIDDFAVESGPDLIRQWMAIMSTGVVWPPDLDHSVDAVQKLGNGSYQCVLHIENGISYRVVIEPSEPAGRHRISRVERKRADFESVYVVIAELRDWKYAEPLGMHVSHEYISRLRTGGLEKSITIGFIKQLDDDMDRLTALPTSDGADPIRGPTTFASVLNLSTGNDRAVSQDNRSVLTAIQPKLGTRQSGRILWIAGCFAAAVIVVSGIRFFRTKSSG